jgi:hypothetical protein
VHSYSWKIIGSMKETETSEPSLLTISAQELVNGLPQLAAKPAEARSADD